MFNVCMCFFLFLQKKMPDDLKILQDFLLQRLDIRCTSYTKDPECEEYTGYTCTLASRVVIYRKAKITPKKIGQFVTVWKRNEAGITTPFNLTDTFDFYLILTEDQDQLGCFIFPKSALAAQGIISTPKRDGKRGFRVYPSWVTPTNKQALKTQQEQLPYFLSLHDWNQQTLALAQSIFHLK